MAVALLPITTALISCAKALEPITTDLLVLLAIALLPIARAFALFITPALTCEKDTVAFSPTAIPLPEPVTVVPLTPIVLAGLPV